MTNTVLMKRVGIYALIFGCAVSGCSWFPSKKPTGIEAKPSVADTVEPVTKDQQKEPVAPAPKITEESRSAEPKVPASPVVAGETSPPPSAPVPSVKEVKPVVGATEPPPAIVKKPVEEKPAAKPVQKKDPNQFVITVAEKTAAHPLYGKGHRLGLVLDGVPGGTAVVKRGGEYEFDVETDPLHDVYFSTSPQGWGASVVTEGVKGQFTYRGTIMLRPTEKSPDLMYYQCRNHNSMGGRIFVVNAETTQAQINKLLASAWEAPPPGEASTPTGGTGDMPMDKAKQKIMLAEMMLRSRQSKSADGGSDAVKSSLANAEGMLQNARKELDAGHKDKAVALADDALKIISSTSQLAINDDAIKAQRARYNELLDSVRNFQESHKQTFERTQKKRGASAAVDYDKPKVNALLSDARALADKNDYEKASQVLAKAERIITEAIHKMLDAQTIVYDLKFETPADEYEYELKRFKGYEELIPIAVNENKPVESVIKLMDGYIEKGRAQKADAEKRAKEGNYPDAISMLLSATEEIRRALRLAGVSQ